jgi:GT2 family glycosyltransferase
MRIFIILPTHNRKNLLKELLTQLEDQIAKTKEAIFSILIVVDGSNDGTIEMLKEEFPEVHVVIGDGSWWYTKSMNEGFKHAKKWNPDYILTLNDDVKIQNDYLIKLVEALKKSPINSIIGSITYTVSLPHQLVFSGVKKIIRWRDKLVKYHPTFANIQLGTLTGIHKTIVLPGRGMLIPYPVLEGLNYFDEKFAQYHSDFDFCLRAKYQGYNALISWDAIIFSYVDKTAKSTSFFRTPFFEFVKGFFDKHSRIYLPDSARYIYRHGIKILFPITFVIFMLATFKAHFINKKLVQKT